MTGIQKLDVDISARYDRYSDFGGTTNPKLAFSWGVTPGLTIRASTARSFTAPALTSRGNAQGITAESNVAAGGAISVPNTFPGAIGIPGCTSATPICNIGTGTTPGLQVNGGNKDLVAEKGKTASVGFDFAPTALPGLRLSATYWTSKYEGAITAPQAAFAIAAPGLNFALQLFPNGATPAQIAAATAGLPFNTAIPTTTYFIYSFQQRNAFNLDAAGIDAEVGYSFSTDLGDFDTNLSVSRKTKMDQSFGSDGEKFSVLNSIGVNTTFPSNKMAARLSLGWKRSSWNTNLYVNYAGSFINWGNTASQGNAAWNITRAVSGTGAALWPVSGGQPISAQTTADLHVGYNFPDTGTLANVKLSLDGNNIFNKDPPFTNTAVGYDGFNGNPIGRTFSLGISRKW
jgi:iron complex outermembrane receptor protein